MLLWGLGFLRSQLFATLPKPTDNFNGQTIIITGANVGLGLEAVRSIVQLGASKAILGVRTISKGEAAAEDIVQSCGVPKDRVEVWQLDMSDTDSIKAFAERTESLERLDAAVLNAGMMSFQWSTTPDGTEKTIAVNTLGTMLLTHLLLPKLRASAQKTGLKGRLAIVGSETMDLTDLSKLETSSGGSILSQLNNRALFRPNQRYMTSKILTYYSLRHLASLQPLHKTSVVLTDVTPGLCHSTLFRDGGNSQNVGGPLARSTEVGARTLVHAVSPTLAEKAHGRFLRDMKVWSHASVVSSEQGQRVAKKWNKELYEHLEMVAPGSTRA